MPEYRELQDGELIISAPPSEEFITHNNYVKCMAEYTAGLELVCPSLPKKSATVNEAEIKKKLRLVKATFESLKRESQEVQRDKEYAQACTAWVAVKAYYLTFYLWMLVYYLYALDERAFQIPHATLLKRIDELFAQGKFVFNKPRLNEVHSCGDAGELKVPSGANLARANPNQDVRLTQILKIITKYKLERFRVDERVSSFRGKKGAASRAKFNAKTIGLTHFFYWYRIKVNYRDLSFLDLSLPDDELASYFSSYFQLTSNTHDALVATINDLAKARMGKPLI